MIDVITRFKAETSEYDRKIKNSKKQLESFGKDSLKNLAGSFGVATSAAVAFGVAIASNIRTAQNFEKSLSSLQSLTGMSGNDMQFFKDAAIELGSTTTQSASQVVDAFKLIGSQKPELLQSKDALKQVTKEAITLAEAAGMEVPEAATALTTALNQFGADASKSSEFINILAAASQQGAGDINYLNTAIVQSGSTAKAVGLQFNETAAAVEAIAKAGIDASTAGTGLRNVLLSLEKQSKDKLKPSVVGLSTALENLGKASMSASEMQELFGRGNVAVASALIGNADVYKTLSKSIVGTSTAYEQAKINTDNLDGAIKSLESAWEGLNLTINSSNSALKPFIDRLTSIVNDSTDIVKAIQSIGNSIASSLGDNSGFLSRIGEEAYKSLSPLGRVQDIWSKIAEYAREYNNSNQGGGGQTKYVSMMASFVGSSSSSSSSTATSSDPIINSIETQKKKIKEITELWESAGTQALRDKYKKQLEEANDELKKMNGQYQDILDKQKQAFQLATKKQMESETKEENGIINSFLTPSINGDLADAFAPGSINALNSELSAARDVLNSCAVGSAEWASALEWVKEAEGNLTLAQDAMNTSKNFNAATDAIREVGNTLGMIENPAAKVASTIALAIADVALAYSKAMSAKDTTASGWAWLGFAAAATGTMIASITAIKSATSGSYANGGVVPGNYNGGVDSTYIYASPGELILNRSQQQNIAGQLQQGNGMHLTATIKGEDIRLALNNNSRRRMRGENVTSK